MGPATNRGVSTAIDVSLALLLVSAAVLVVVVFYNPSPPPANPVGAEQTAEMLSATTLKVDYSLEPVSNDDDFDAGSGVINDIIGTGGVDSEDLQRTTHGPVTDLLAAAAVTRATVDTPDLPDEEERISLAAENFVEEMEGDIRDVLTNSSTQAHVVAVWRPYEGSSIQGRAEVGPQPPAGEDVSLVRMTVDNRLATVSDEEIRARYEADGLSGVANLTAGAIVEGHFDAQEAQLALEKGEFEGAFAGYRFTRWQTVLNNWHGRDSPPEVILTDVESGVDYKQPFRGGGDSYNYIGGNSPRAREAIGEIRRELAADLRIELADRYSGGVTGEQLAEDVVVDEVTIVVHTW